MLDLARRSRRTGLSPIVLVLPVALFVLLYLSSGTFRSQENLANVNSQIAALMIASLGQGIVAISGGIDLSVGSVMSLTSAILVTADPAWGVPIALAMGAGVGLINGFGVTLFKVHPLVMTLATTTIVQGVAVLLPGGAVPGYLRALAVSQVAGVPAAFFWCGTAILLAWYLLGRSRFGLRTYAVGANPISAGRNGIAVARLKVACFVLCSLAAVVAGIFLTARVGAGDATMGNPYSLDTVTAMALGGIQLAGGSGSVLGIVAGVLMLGLISNGMNLMGVSPFLQRREAIGA
jgi:ribose transport system permease protein